MTKPFLLLSTRPEDDAVVGERAAILAKAGLEEAELAQHRVERFPLPDLDLGDFAGVLLGGGPFNSSDEDKSELQLRVEAELLRLPLGEGQSLIGVTLSIGWACGHDEPFEALLDRADRALYRAKQGGRNRVESGLA